MGTFISSNIFSENGLTASTISATTIDVTTLNSTTVNSTTIDATTISGDTFYGDGSGLTSINTPINTQNILWVDSILGDDGTAQPDRQDISLLNNRSLR